MKKAQYTRKYRRLLTALRQARKDAGLTQVEVAVELEHAIDLLGKSRPCAIVAPHSRGSSLLSRTAHFCEQQTAKVGIQTRPLSGSLREKVTGVPGADARSGMPRKLLAYSHPLVMKPYNLTLTGADGMQYVFTMLPFDSPLPNDPGIAVVAHAHPLNEKASKHEILYVACTTNLSKALSAEARKMLSEEYKANVIGVKIEHSEYHCTQLTNTLTLAYDPPCNI